MSPSNEQIDRLAWEIAEHGVIRSADAVRRVASLARSLGVTGASLDVLDDPTQPDIARARAFGRVAAEVVAALSAPLPHPAAA